MPERPFFIGNLFLGWEKAISRDGPTPDRTDNCQLCRIFGLVSFSCENNHQAPPFSSFFPFFLAFIDHPPSVNILRMYEILISFNNKE